MHPGAVGGIERDIARPQQRLAVFRLRDGGLGHLEMLRPQFPGRLLDQQNLTIDGVVHGVPSRILVVLDAGERAENTQPHTLCAAA